MHGDDLSARQLLVDRLAIHDLVNRYAAGVDDRDFDAVAACFAPDVRVVDWGGRDFADRDDLIEFIGGVAAFDLTMHMMGNQHIAVAADRATVDTRARLAHRLTRPDGSLYELDVDGRYVERLARIDGEWRIVQRGGDPPEPDPALVATPASDPAIGWLLDRAIDDERRADSDEFIGLEPYDGPPAPATPDAITAMLVDRAAIRDVVAAEGPDDVARVVNNHVATIERDRAAARTYAYIGEPWHRGATVFVDRLERTTGGWRVADREVRAWPSSP